MQIAILGVSNISETSALAMKNVGIKLEACLSRDMNKAIAFKEKLEINKAYDDYDALLNDSDIDTVYVGLPNSLHYEYAKKALLANKNVLLEKPFTISYAQSVELKNLAVSRHLYLFETIITLYQPLLADINEYLKKIGPIHLAILNFTKYSSKYDEYLAGNLPNIFNVEMGGGALNDLNIYNLHIAYDLFGKPNKVTYFGNYSNGVDTSGIANLSYPGLEVSCIAGKDSDSESFIYIMGEKGYIKVNGAPSVIKNVELYDHEGNHEVRNDTTNPYENEFKVMDLIIKKGSYKTHLNLLNRSLEVMKLLEDAHLNSRR